jgi:hypothetical protein
MSRLNDLLDSNYALSLEFDTESGIFDGPESWLATLDALDSEDETKDPVRETVAQASLVRVHFEENWADQLDAVSGDLESVAGALSDRNGVVASNPFDYGYIDDLVIIDFISVPEQHRGRKLSHLLAKSISLIFPDSVIALVPAQLSSAGSELVDDPVKHEALIKHWAAMGFVSAGGNVMVLPLEARSA